MTREEALGVLGLGADAGRDEISAAYRELAQMLHPDKFGENKRLRARAEQQMRRINEARDVLLKGPLTTPRPGDPYPNLVSANSLLRRGLDLFVGMRPIRMADKGIDWTFFRENLEGEYIWGDKGIQVTDDLAVDFKVCTLPGTERLAAPLTRTVTGRERIEALHRGLKRALRLVEQAVADGESPRLIEMNRILGHDLNLLAARDLALVDVTIERLGNRSDVTQRTLALELARNEFFVEIEEHRVVGQLPFKSVAEDLL